MTGLHAEGFKDRGATAPATPRLQMLAIDAELLVAAIILRLELRPAPRGTGLDLYWLTGSATRAGALHGRATGQRPLGPPTGDRGRLGDYGVRTSALHEDAGPVEIPRDEVAVAVGGTVEGTA